MNGCVQCEAVISQRICAMLLDNAVLRALVIFSPRVSWELIAGSYSTTLCRLREALKHSDILPSMLASRELYVAAHRKRMDRTCQTPPPALQPRLQVPAVY